MQHVFIIGSKGIPGSYGGYETFVDKLTEYHQKHDIKYHVACKNSEEEEFEYHGARCFEVKVPNIGSAQAIYYDVCALMMCCKYIRKNNIKNPIVYILACRIGPFIKYFVKKIHKLNGRVYINPDGHEWKRAKWGYWVRKYWKLSEKLMVKFSDLVVCDSKNIEKYIKEEYAEFGPRTTYISYGAEIGKSDMREYDEKYQEWLNYNKVDKNEYYLIVGRFVPENNYECMIREFMKSNSMRDLVIITDNEGKFLTDLQEKTKFQNDERIKFVGTVYDQELLRSIRKNAYGYLHGHEVGGTNPSLLEALGSTSLNLLLNVGFNKEVAEDSALYWEKTENSLSGLIDMADSWEKEEIELLGEKAKNRIAEFYSWEYISDLYENLFRG